MAKDKLLTKTILVQTLKQMGMATKKDLVNFVTKDDLKTGFGKLERRLVIRMNKMERSLRQSHYGLI